MPNATYALEIDWDNSGGFVDPYSDEDVTADLISANIVRGYSGPMARVPLCGRATFVLDNSSQAYSPPLGAAVLPMRPVRFQMTYSGTTKTLFRGYVNDIIPEADQYGMRRVTFECVDAISILDRHEGETSIRISAYADDVIAEVVAAAYTPPATDYEAGINLFPVSCERWAWTTGTSGQESGRNETPTEQVCALDRIADACIGDWGRFFIKGDGTAAYYNRHHMPLDASTVAVLDDTMTEMGYRKTADTIYNHIEVTCNPRDIGQVREVLGEFSQSRATVIEANSSRTFILRFRDPYNTTRLVGGYNCRVPVANTDYQCTDDEAGDGTDVTASVTAAATFYGDHAEITLTNALAAPVWIQKLQVRGRAVRTRDMITMIASDAVSIAAYGKRKLPVLVPMMSAPEDAQTLADYLLAIYKDPVHEIRNLAFVANDSDVLMTAARDLDLMDRIEVTETQTGLSSMVGHVFALTHEINSECQHTVQMSLETPYVLGTPFRLDISQLNSGHVLIY